MKNKYLLVCGAFLAVNLAVFGQLNPVSYSTPFANNPNQAITTANGSWYRGGNFNTGPAGNANIFGTNWNSPIYTVTNGTNRTKLNGSFTAPNQYPIDGYATFGNTNTTVNTSGYMLLGPNGTFQTQANQNIYNNKGAYSLLHLNGSAPIQQNGYRPWMKTGITFTDNQDMSYFGLRQIGDQLDWTETVLNWSDNQGGLEDDMCFRFTGSPTSSTTVDQTNLRSTQDLDGLHIARYTANGRYGLGNTFGHVNAPGHPISFYVAPQSLFHMSYDRQNGAANEAYGFMQVTYRDNTGIIGSGETAQDGLRLGISNTLIVPAGGGASYLSGFLRWQENSPFIVQTDWNTVAGGIEGGERLRVSSISAPGVPNPAGLNANTTRVAISHNGASPITQPRSLLHLGYNTGGLLGSTVDGWRDWMDVGTFTAGSTDNMYVGLKREAGFIPAQNDRYDAVINWGDNQNNLGGAANIGPDNLRFIFTSTTGLGGGDPVSQSNDGLEVMRMVPTKATTLPNTNFGMVGIGNFYSANTLAPDVVNAKLDIDGDLRIRTVTERSDLTQVLVIDPNDKNRVHWKTILPDTIGSFGVPCEDTINANLLVNRKVNLNENNFYFERDVVGSINNNVGFGWDCGTILKAKVDAVQRGVQGIAGSFLTYRELGATGARGFASGDGLGTGIYFGLLGASNGLNSAGSYGVYGTTNSEPNSFAGYFNGDVYGNTPYTSSDSTLKQNVTNLNGSLKVLSQLKPVTYFYKTAEYSQFNLSPVRQYGFLAQEVATVLPELVKSAVQPGQMEEDGTFSGGTTNFLTLNYNGLIPLNTSAIIELNQKVEKLTLSDESVKSNVVDLNGSLNKVLNMRGVSYDWNHAVHPELNLDSANHIGFIAQEMQQIDARLTYLADDSLLHVEYDKVVPILAEAIQELHGSVVNNDSIITALQLENAAQQNTINDLNNRLASLENCLSGILPMLCQMSNSSIQPTQETVQQELRTAINVQLSDKNTIILNQNVPNPFAETTVITYSIPATVGKAQIHFYDATGKLINSVDIVERGAGEMKVFANDLSTGIYTYSLVADGVVVSTKRMAKN